LHSFHATVARRRRRQTFIATHRHNMFTKSGGADGFFLLLDIAAQLV